MQKKRYMFDTNIFNNILDRKIDLDRFVGRATFYATHIQFDELSNTKDSQRRTALLGLFGEITGVEVPTESFVLDTSRLDQARLGGDQVIPTESWVWGISRWGQARWTASDNLYDPIKSELDRLNHAKPNNIKDALISETTIKNELTLVTHDRDLFHVTTKFGGACANFFQVLKDLTEAMGPHLPAV